MRARALVLVLLLACSKSAGPPPQQPSKPADDGHGSAAAAAPAEGGAAPKWGASVSDPKAEREAVELFAAIAGGKAKPDAVLAPVFVIGPALWQSLAKTDAAFAKLGTPSQAALPSGGTTTMLDMRSYLEPEARKALLAHHTFVTAAKLLTQGKPRAATDAERSLFYALSPIEIAGHPLTVIDLGQTGVIVFVDHGKLAWIDEPSAYTTKP